MAEGVPVFTPVNLITGFLGSGKTTLLRRLLADPGLADTAVLINEFGEVGLDHHLLDRIDDTMVLLQSGCLCCTIRGELSQAIRDLQSKRDSGIVPAFDRLVVESTGLADPFPIVSTLKADPVLRHHFRMSNVVTTVDTMNGLAQIGSHPESIRQAAAADRIVMTKTDLSDQDRRARLLARIRALNPSASIHWMPGDVDVEELLGRDALSAATSATAAEAWLSEALGDDCGDGEHHRHHGHDHGGHLDHVRSFAIVVEDPIDWTAFGIWLTMLLNRHGDRILRVKGILALAGEDRPVAIHGVQHLVHAPVHMSTWPGGERRSRIVFIVDDLDPETIRRSFYAFNCHRAPAAL